jgi:hypothetical protein
MRLEHARKPGSRRLVFSVADIQAAPRAVWAVLCPRLLTSGAISGFICSHLLEWQAGRVEDPSARLKFLRTMTQSPGTRRPAAAGTWRRRAGALVLIALVAVAGSSHSGLSGANKSVQQPAPVTHRFPAQSPVSAASVWLVERTSDFELYSNGLRIERDSLSTSRPRLARALRRLPGGRFESLERPDPAGIVFHSSESEMAPFEASHAEAVKRQGAGLLSYVRNGHLYNFVIDRFGRVHRILEDSEKADHAGHSIWADRNWVYIDLNETFLGVSFEAGGENEMSRGGTLSKAQLHAGRVLTEMLRSRYGIPAENCVTHAQVSVNPSNFRIGYHTDWANNFPFEELGLGNNYEQPLPSVSLFGFEYDDAYLASAGAPLRESLPRSKEEARQAAVRSGLSPTGYRTVLRGRYLQMRKALRIPTFPQQG